MKTTEIDIRELDNGKFLGSVDVYSMDGLYERTHVSSTPRETDKEALLDAMKIEDGIKHEYFRRVVML